MKIDAAKAASFYRGEIILVDIPTEGKPMTAFFQLKEGRLRAGIFSIMVKENPSGAFRAFAGFRNTAIRLARAVQMPEVELMGAAVHNSKVEQMLLRRGFAMSEEVTPELGGLRGENVEVLSKRFPVTGVAAGEISRTPAVTSGAPTIGKPEPTPSTRPAAQGEGGTVGEGRATTEPLSVGRRVAGLGADVFTFGIPILAGLAAGPAIKSRVEERRDKTGYAPESLDYFDESGSRLLAATRYLVAPSASEPISAADRFNISVWRQRLREKADQTLPGGTISVTWMVQVGTKEDIFLHPVPDISPIKIVYKKGAKGWWLDVAELSEEWPAKAPIPYAPDLNRIIDPARSDKEINTLLGREIKA